MRSALSTQHSVINLSILKRFLNGLVIFIALGIIQSAEATCYAADRVIKHFFAYNPNATQAEYESLYVPSKQAACDAGKFWWTREHVNGVWVLIDRSSWYNFISSAWAGANICSYEAITTEPYFVAMYAPNKPPNATFTDVLWASHPSIKGPCGEQTTLSLTPAPNQKDPRPKGTETKDDKSTYELIAKVIEGSTPKAGVAVTFAVDVEPNTGGHDHHDASRPKGLVNGKLTASGVTEANGEIKVTFQASEFSGTHVVAAVCDSCTNKSVTKNVDVKVPGLSPLGHDMGPPTFIYWGSTPKHFSNHWFTAPAKISLAKLIETLFAFEWFPIGVNDGSLPWGGSFDVPGHWAVGTNHAEHRIGEEVDLSFSMGTNAAKIKRSYYKICLKEGVDISSTILWHDIPLSEGGKYAPHFHVRLNGTFAQGVSTGKPARCSRDSEK